MAAVKPVDTERVPLREVFGRVLREDVVSDISMPPFDKATVDGYACRRSDAARPLRVVETVPAGRAPTAFLDEGLCAKIMTGARVPKDLSFLESYYLERRCVTL